MALAGRYRFGKELRLRKRREFLAVQGFGRRRRGRSLVIIARRREGGGRTRIGVTVSRKVGCAVVRNRVKRLIREAFRLQQWEIPPDLDVVAIAKREAVDATLDELSGEILGATRSLARQLRPRAS